MFPSPLRITAEAIMKDIGITHPQQALTVKQAAYAVNLASSMQDDLGFLFQHPNFQKNLQDKNDAVSLYNVFKNLFGWPANHETSYLKDLRAFAFNHGFPEQFTSVSEIMAYHQGESVHFLVETPAFVKFTDDLNGIESLLHEIRNGGEQVTAIWTKHIEELEGKASLFRLHAALKNGRISDSDIFRDYFHNDWRLVRRLWLKFKDNMKLTDTMVVVGRIARNEFQNHLKNLKTINDMYLIVKSFQDKETLDILQKSELYKTIIHDPYQVFQLNQMLNFENIPDQSHSFFKDLHLGFGGKFRTPEKRLRQSPPFKNP